MQEFGRLHGEHYLSDFEHSDHVNSKYVKRLQQRNLTHLNRVGKDLKIVSRHSLRKQELINKIVFPYPYRNS